MVNPFRRVMWVFVLSVTTGCAAHFDVPTARAAYAASGGDPGYQACAARVLAAEESFNDHAAWWSRSVVAGIVLGAAVSALGIATGLDTPGKGAISPDDAVSKERGFSRLELATGTLAALAGGDALIAWYSTDRMSRRARQIADDLARCPPRAAEPLPAITAPPTTPTTPEVPAPVSPSTP